MEIGRDLGVDLSRHASSRLGRKAVEDADLILANAPNACRLFRETYPHESDRIVTLTNGFDPRSSPGEARLESVAWCPSQRTRSGRPRRARKSTAADGLNTEARRHGEVNSQGWTG